MKKIHIPKNLESEVIIKDPLIYIPLAGASEVTDFRSPDSFVFIFFEKCKGIHSIDFTEYQERDNQVHISFPGQIHSWKTEAGAYGHKLIVEKNFGRSHFSSTQINRCPVIDLPEYYVEKLSQEFVTIKNELKADSVNWHIVTLRAQIILKLISTLTGQQIDDDIKKEKYHPLIPKFMSLLELNYTESKSVAYYADKLAITPNYLSIVTRNHLKQSAKEVIDSRVILEAKRLLLGSTLSIKEIAYDLGFSSGSAFTAFMIDRTGLSPTAYRSI